MSTGSASLFAPPSTSFALSAPSASPVVTPTQMQTAAPLGAPLASGGVAELSRLKQSQFALSERLKGLPQQHPDYAKLCQQLQFITKRIQDIHKAAAVKIQQVEELSDDQLLSMLLRLAPEQRSLVLERLTPARRQALVVYRNSLQQQQQQQQQQPQQQQQQVRCGSVWRSLE